MNAALIQKIFQTKPDVIQTDTGKHENKLKFSFQCPKCIKKFIALPALAVHYRKKHKALPVPAVKTTKVTKSTTKYEVADPPLDPERPYVCSVPGCGKAFKNPGGRNTHKYSVHGKESPKIIENQDEAVTSARVFPCNICGKIFKNSQGKRSHTYSVHAKDRPQSLIKEDETEVETKFFCDICEKYFKTYAAEKAHKYQIHGKADLRKIVKEEIKAETNPENDVTLLKDEEKRYTCEICLKSFKSASVKNNHKYSVHGKEKLSNQEKRFTCDICFKSFKTASVKNSHKYSVHGKGKQIRTCAVCSKQFHDPQSLRIHMSVHTGLGMVACEKCGKLVHQFRMTRHLKMHEMQPVDCEICGKTCTNELTKKIHVNKVHEKIVQGTCSFCGKLFYDKYALKAHIKGHAKTGKSECTVCGKVTATSSMAQHMLIHGEKRYRCDECGKSFAQPAGLRLHLPVHGVVKPPPSVIDVTKRTCDICNLVLSCASALGNHKKIIHRIGAHECSYCGKTFTSLKNERARD